jgi:hypothetical protein
MKADDDGLLLRHPSPLISSDYQAEPSYLAPATPKICLSYSWLDRIETFHGPSRVSVHHLDSSLVLILINSFF